MKGVSPLVAVVLLIAFTVAIGGIVSIWLTGFTTTTTKTVGEQASYELICSYGGISIKGLKFYSSTSRLVGLVDNTRTIALGNITLQILYQNASTQKIYLNDSAGNYLTLSPREQASFNVSISSNYDRIRVMTNCTNVYDEASRNDVTLA